MVVCYFYALRATSAVPLFHGHWAIAKQHSGRNPTPKGMAARAAGTNYYEHGNFVWNHAGGRKPWGNICARRLVRLGHDTIA